MTVTTDRCPCAPEWGRCLLPSLRAHPHCPHLTAKRSRAMASERLCFWGGGRCQTGLKPLWLQASLHGGRSRGHPRLTAPGLVGAKPGVEPVWCTQVAFAWRKRRFSDETGAHMCVACGTKRATHEWNERARGGACDAQTSICMFIGDAHVLRHAHEHAAEWCVGGARGDGTLARSVFERKK